MHGWSSLAGWPRLPEHRATGVSQTQEAKVEIGSMDSEQDALIAREAIDVSLTINFTFKKHNMNENRYRANGGQVGDPI